MSAIVYAYGAPKRLHGAEVTLPPEVDEQLRLAHDLREDLVSIWQARQDALASVWSSEPEIAECETRIADAEAQAEQLGTQAAKERSAVRAKGATASTPRLKELRATIREARASRRELITGVRAARADDLERVENDHAAAVKATYRAYCQQGGRGLYWATYNDVLAHHKTAAKRVSAARAAGRPAQLRHHRYDGSGSIAVQLQRQAGVPPRTPATIADGEWGKWRNVLQVTPWVDPTEWGQFSRAEQRRQRLGVARMNVGQGRVVELPVLVHRMLPADADITSARLVVRRVAGHRKTELHVTALIGDPAPPVQGPVVALHLGWRADTERGAVRVATWRSTAPVTVPAELADVVVADTDRTGQVVLDATWRARVDAHDAISSDRDVALDKIRAQLVAWLVERATADPTLPELPAADRVLRWRSPGRFARLALDWRANPPPGGADMATALEAWRASDRRMWEPHAHGRAGALAARDDTYRRFAAWVAGFAGRVVVDDTAITTLARRPDPASEPDLPSMVTQRAARQRTLAAPGRLREIVLSAATRRGVPTVTVAHGGTTRTHYRCGHLNPADDRYAASRIVTCDGCGQGYDQDASATLMMLAASGDVPPPGPGTARAVR